MEADILLCDYYIGYYSMYTNSLSVSKQSISLKTMSQAQVRYFQAFHINQTNTVKSQQSLSLYLFV